MELLKETETWQMYGFKRLRDMKLYSDHLLVTVSELHLPKSDNRKIIWRQSVTFLLNKAENISKDLGEPVESVKCFLSELKYKWILILKKDYGRTNTTLE